jgi:hypothetical protein
MQPPKASGEEAPAPRGFSRRLRLRHELWWGRPRGLSDWRRAGDVLHRLAERHRLRSRNDPDEAWRCCEHWQRTLIHKWNGREFAARHGVPLPELYWFGRSLWRLPVRSLPARFAVRPVFGRKRRGVYVVANGRELLRRETLGAAGLRRRLAREHGPLLLEPILVEAFAAPEDGGDRLPTECKFHVFRDVVAAIEVIERASILPEDARVRFLTPGWEPFADPMLTGYPRAEVGDPPRDLDAMLAHALRLGETFGSYVRVDFFATDRGCLFNELSSTPRYWSLGYTPFCSELFESLWQEKFPNAS